MKNNYWKTLLTMTGAAIVALCIACAGMFPAQTVAGREDAPATLHGAAALEQLKQGGQYDSLQAAMQQARFSVSNVAHSPLGRPAWHAPNAAAGYDAYVTEMGVSIAVKDSPVVSLSLHSLGYGAAMQTLAPGQVSGDKQSITITRDGVREWFVNGADGLEHGFTLNAPPSSARQQGVSLRLALQVSEGWRAVAGEDGKRVALRGANSQAVEYGKLVARDARGLNMPARLTVADEQVVIEVEDHAAQYPLTIDPLFTLQKQLLASDGQAFDYFGYAVALDGNTALVGAPYDEVTHTDQGSVYVFVRSGTTWTFQQKLSANDGQPGDKFGSAVALRGDTALIGAPEDDEGADPEIGSAYVFVRSGTSWSFQQKLGASGGMAGGLFGSAVALDGNTALVGAHQQTITPSFATTGAAYVFVRSGATPNATWTPQQRLLMNDPVDNDFFGFSVALDGDTALVGAPGKTITASTQGAAYIFTRSGTVWTQQPRLNLDASNAGANDRFGSAVALSADKAAVSAPLFGNNDTGAVFTAVRGATGWALTETTRAPNSTAGAHFGVSVALEGDTLVVGASLGIPTLGVDQRSAYVFAFNGDWEFVRQLGGEVGHADDRFGYAVALDGDTVLVGAYRADAATINQGAAYVFVLHDSRHIEQQKVFANDGAPGDRFGNAVALDGNTLVVGAEYDNVGTNAGQGSVYVFRRNGTSWTFQQKLSANDGVINDFFGHAVALSGDTVAVGAVGDDIGMNLDQGSVYIFTRNGTGWTFQQKLLAEGIDALQGDNLGSAVALSGETVVVVGARGVNLNQGTAYVFTRNGTVWTQQAKLIANGLGSPAYYGDAVALSGDTAVVGAPLDNTFRGSVHVFTRNGTVWTFQQKLAVANGAIGDHFGSAVAVSGDTLVAGVPFEKIGANVKQGSAYVFTRSGTAWTQQPKLIASDGAADESFGYSVALGGDTLVIGTHSNSLGLNSKPGAAYVFTRLGYFIQQQKLIPSDGASQDFFGSAVALSGDTVAVGAPYDDIGTTQNQGSAYVFVSPPCPAITITPASLPNGALGVAYDQSITESGGGLGEYVLSVSRGALPPGLRLIFLPGRLQGTPTTPGTYRFTITATYPSSLCTGSREYTVTITPPCPTITLNSPTLPGGALGVDYNQTLTATGGAAPVNFTISEGELPGGLNLAASGALTGTPNALGVFNFTVRATDANGCQGTHDYALAINQTGGGATGLQFYPLPRPVRILDTRAGAGNCDNISAPINGGSSLSTFARLTCEGITIPANAQAIAGNLTIINQTNQGGYLTIYPDGQNAPLAANMIYEPDGILANNFTVGLGLNGDFDIFAERTLDAIVDISGYYAAPGAGGLYYHPLPKPVRMMDTRANAGNCDNVNAPIAAGTSLTKLAHKTCEGLTIPQAAQAIVGNATVINGSGQVGYLTLYPNGVAPPVAANLIYFPEQILTNAFTVSLSAGGEFNIFAERTIDVVVDVAGYYSNEQVDANGRGLLFTPLAAPVRLLDTRANAGNCDNVNAPIAGGTSLTKLARMTCEGQVIPNAAQAIIGNVTVINQTNQAGYLTLYPTGQAAPLAANMIYQPSQILSNAFVVGLSGTGQFNVFAEWTLEAIVDVSGYFAP